MEKSTLINYFWHAYFAANLYIAGRQWDQFESTQVNVLRTPLHLVFGVAELIVGCAYGAIIWILNAVAFRDLFKFYVLRKYRNLTDEELARLNKYFPGSGQNFREKIHRHLLQKINQVHTKTNQ